MNKTQAIFFLLMAESVAREKEKETRDVEWMIRADEIREDYQKFCNGEYDYLLDK